MKHLRFWGSTILVVILLAAATLAQDAKESPIPKPDALTQQDTQIAYMNKYIGKLQGKIVEMQGEIDRLAAENKVLREK